MSEAKQGDTVRVHYTGRLGSGEVFDTSQERDPLEFTIGSGEVIPGFEIAVEGMNVGEQKTVVLAPENAYGEHNETMVQRVSRADMPPEIKIEVGMMLQAMQSNNQPIVLTVTDIDDESVTLDANHPLAGKELTFDIQLVEIV